MTTRLDALWDSMQQANERLLVTHSVTEELESWCTENAIGDGRIAALVERNRDALRDFNPRNEMRFRRVRLATANVVVARALNWFLPATLPLEACRLLETTDIPFGKVIRDLRPRRRTFFARKLSRTQLEQAVKSADPSQIAFEHRAIVSSGDGTPLAVVHERFCLSLLSSASSAVTSAATIG